MCQVCGCEPCETCGAAIDGATGCCSGCSRFALECDCSTVEEGVEGNGSG